MRVFRRDCYEICDDETIIFAWAQNAPPLELPAGDELFFVFYSCMK